MKIPSLLKLIVCLPLVLVVFAAAFVLPAHKPRAHDVPLALVGPPRLAQTLEHQRPGALDVESYSSEVDARRAIDHREVYGALIADRGSRRLLIASAASATVAQTLRTIAESQGPIVVDDVKPLVAEDPRGSTLNALFLALVMASSIAVLVLTSGGCRGLRLVGAISLFAVLGSLTVVGLVGEAIGALPGSFAALSAVTALVLFAVALPIAGLQRVLGKAGAAIGGLFFVLLANPASGNAGAPELLPGFWRQLSQLMPPGAGGTSLRNVAYFDGNAVLHPLLVLSVYAVAGLTLVALGERVRQRRANDEFDTPADSPADETDLKEAA